MNQSLDIINAGMLEEYFNITASDIEYKYTQCKKSCEKYMAYRDRTIYRSCLDKCDQQYNDDLAILSTTCTRKTWCEGAYLKGRDENCNTFSKYCPNGCRKITDLAAVCNSCEQKTSCDPNGNLFFQDSDCNTKTSQCEYGCEMRDGQGFCKSQPQTSKAIVECRGDILYRRDVYGREETLSCPYGCYDGVCNAKPAICTKKSWCESGNRITRGEDCLTTTGICKYGCENGVCKPAPKTNTQSQDQDGSGTATGYEQEASDKPSPYRTIGIGAAVLGGTAILGILVYKLVK